jgi:hypothetical protein
MSAPESTKFQANFKTASGALYNVYASSTEEFISALNDMGDLVAVITSVEQALATGQTIAQHIPLAPASQQAAPVQAPAPVQQPVQDASSAAPSTPMCRHGAMEWKTGSKNGKDWKAWMCSAAKGAADKCDPQWVR